MKIYSNQAVDNLTEQYIKRDGEITVIEEGCLASYGLAILTAPKSKTAIVKEVYLNSQSSGNSIKLYNKIPKKYQTMINNN